MKYVGIDLHKKVIVFCGVGQDRSILQRGRFLCQDGDRIRQFFGKLGDFQAVVEATANYEWLVDILLPLAKRAVSAADRFVLRQLLTERGQAQKQLVTARMRLRSFAKKGSASEQRDRQVLRTIPGVGEVTSEVVLAELAGAERFRSEKQAVGFAGLAPGRRESAGKAVDLGISKQGSRLLRWILVEAAWSTVRYSKMWRNRYEKLKSRCGAKKAIVAMARRLLCVIVAVLRSGEAYREVEPAATEGSSEQPKPETTTKTTESKTTKTKTAETKTAKTKTAETKTAETKTAKKRQRSASA